MNQLIVDQIEKLIRDENREFMIAYGSLPDEFHGYLSALPQKVRVWGINLPDAEFKELKEAYPNVRQWTKDNKGSGVFYEINIPFLGVDGCLAMARKDSEKVEIQFETVQTGNLTFVKALVNVNGSHSEGIAILSPDASRTDAIEIAASNALRKSLSYLGYGRFATYETPYGENKLVKEFRDFVKKRG